MTCIASCAGKVFTAKLGSKQGVSAHKYTFEKVRAKSTSGSYSNIMVETCKKIGMKPICDHRNYCRNDAKSLYIGQDHHLTHGGHMNHHGYFPSGWSQIRSKFNGLCSYTARANGDYALCNIPSNSHSWRRASQTPDFMCGIIGNACMRAHSGSGRLRLAWRV